MSRSALWKQEGKVKERERRAEAIFEEAVEEGRQRSASASKKSAVLPLWGPDDSFHINPLLLQNTIQSLYFQKCCENLKDWNAVIDEIYYEVKHVLPFQTGKLPSTAFCLLLRLLLLRMTAHQLDLTLKHVDSPYIRCIGFLYLRYAGPPEHIWEWIAPYMHDDEPVQVEPPGKMSTTTDDYTIGDYVRNLFSARDYYGTSLPRFPVLIERDLLAHILQANHVAERASKHYKNGQRMKYFETLGSTVMALYGDEENPIEWYEAVVDRVIRTSEEDGRPLKYPKFIVTFTEYGNTETVLLGEMDVLDGEWRNSRRGGIDNAYEEVLRRERGSVASTRGWAPRGPPPTTKSSMTSTVTAAPSSSRGYRSQSHHHANRNHHDDRTSRGLGDNTNQRQHQSPPPPSSSSPRQQNADTSRGRSPTGGGRGGDSFHQDAKKRTAQDMATVEEKKRRLMAKYG